MSISIVDPPVGQIFDASIFPANFLKPPILREARVKERVNIDGGVFHVMEFKGEDGESISEPLATEDHQWVLHPVSQEESIFFGGDQ